MKVFLRPTGLHSRAMVRVAQALAMHAPRGVEIVDNQRDSDFRVFHAIGSDLYHGADENQPHAIIQYCLKSAGLDWEGWAKIWHQSQLVWSYYDLTQYPGSTSFNFYHAPLGIDPTFVYAANALQLPSASRSLGVMTSGYVSHPAAEAIEEVALAAARTGLHTVHLGPSHVEGMTIVPPNWYAINDISDESLASILGDTRWVSGLRHTEGFELPALEGLMCGARPIVFDRADMHQWYNGHAVFVKDCAGSELVDLLEQVFTSKPTDVSVAERRAVAARFHWKTIAHGFWSRLM